ncbi:restriction endonuclease subunit S [Ascidiimonas aurantiaca]|uniref:restriction endonuclease subunit S n=1 Tax=Ascidiimonas aurantiaca TaxID=1685432 RepID=UPI0030EC574A
MSKVLKPIPDTEKRPGYKHTKLGWIPEDWEIFRFDEVFQFIPTYSYSRNQLIKCQPNDNDIFNIHYGDIHTSFHNEQLDFDKDIEVASLLNPVIDIKKLKLLKEGDLVIADASEDYEGICDAIELKNVRNRKIIGGLHTFAVRDKNGLTANGYRGFIFKNEIVKHNLKRVATGISVLGVSKSNISKILIPLPSPSEQVVISKVLLKWDSAITKLNELIKAKQKSKKGLMHLLLTGKKRLPGFDGEWQEQKLSVFFTERKETNRDDLELLSIGEAGVYPQSLSNKKDTSNNDKSKYKRICPGDIGYNTMRMWQGRSALSHLEGIVSPAYTIVKPKEEADSVFFSYFFKVPSVVHKFYRNSQGLVSDTLNCKFKDFAMVKVLLPKNKDEQTAIAQILSAADKEIYLLKEQLEQLEQQKRGMMQQLLMGKERLPL